MKIEQYRARLAATRKPRATTKTTKRKSVKKPESALLRTVLARLKLGGYWHWRNNSGLMVVGTGAARRAVQLSPVGSPDILLVIGRGRLCGVELKAPGEKQSPAQVAWQTKAESRGVGYCLAYSVVEVMAAVEEWSRA